MTLFSETTLTPILDGLLKKSNPSIRILKTNSPETEVEFRQKSAKNGNRRKRYWSFAGSAPETEMQVELATILRRKRKCQHRGIKGAFELAAIFAPRPIRPPALEWRESVYV